VTRERLDLAPLRWEDLAVDCGALHQPETDLHGVIMRAAEERLEAAGLPADSVLGLRVVLTGETDDPVALTAAVATLEKDALVTGIADRTVFVDRVASEAHARVDLDVLARDRDPVGLLAHRVLVLQGSRGDEALLARLLEGCRAATAGVDGQPAYRHLEAAVDDASLRRAAAAAARRLLDRMLAAREAGP
jgi:hypothetical protein